MDTRLEVINLEVDFNLFISGLFEKAGIELNEATSLDEALTQDYAELLNRLEAHLDFALRVSDTLE